MKKQWADDLLRLARQNPTWSNARLAFAVHIHPETLRKKRRSDPEFEQALQDARERRTKAGEVVSIEQFVRDPQYLGLGVRGLDPGGTVYPVVMEELTRIASGNYGLVLLLGGIGGGKTFAAVVLMLYEAFKLMIQPDPHKACGLDPSSPIIFAVQNKNVRLATRNDYALTRRLIERSPKFQMYFPHDLRTKSFVKFTNCAVEIWPVGGDSEGVIGTNLHTFILDEGNYFAVTERSSRAVDGNRYDGARESFESGIRRKLSRFDELVGMILVASSRRYRGEFTSELEAEYGDDPRTYIYSHTSWSVNPEAYAAGSWFNVFVGDQTRPARVLADDERVTPADRSLVVRVPQKFRKQFANNVTRSVQDLAGIAVERIGSYFTDKAALHRAASLKNVLVSTSDVTADATLLFPGLTEFSCPTSPRAVHVDLSLSGDSTGIAVAHLRGYDDEGRPLIDVDALARVRPPRGGQNSIDSVFRLVAAWKAHGVPVEWFSADGFQSADLLQRVQRLQIRAGKVSVDMTSPGNPTEAYECLRVAVLEGRVRFPFDETAIAELLALELDQGRQRVDHPPSGSKDSADALAGVCFQLSRIPAWQLVGKIEGAAYAAAVAGPTLGGTMTPVFVESGAMWLVRQMQGMPERG